MCKLTGGKEIRGVLLLAEHISDEIHLLFCGGDLLCRRGLRAAESEHRHDCGLYARLVARRGCRLECACCVDVGCEIGVSV
jgi:hypothetical protein